MKNMKSMKNHFKSLKGFCHGITTLGERGQLVIPLEARKKLKLKQKDKLFVFSRFDKVLVLVKMNELQSLLDILLPAGVSLKMARPLKEIKLKKK